MNGSGMASRGPIPAKLASLVGLTRLDLSDNALSGPIPPELGDLAALTSLALRHNNLTGPIPPELASSPRWNR